MERASSLIEESFCVSIIRSMAVLLDAAQLSRGAKLWGGTSREFDRNDVVLLRKKCDPA